MGKRAQALFSAVAEFLHIKFLEHESSTTNDKINITNKIMMILGCFSGLLDISPIFIHFLTKSMMSIHPGYGKTEHKCAFLSYVDADHEEECKLEIEVNEGFKVDDDGKHP